MTRGEIRIRAQEPEDLAAIAEICTGPTVRAATLQVPVRSRAERRARLTPLADGVHRLVAEVAGRVGGTLALQVEANPRRRHGASLGMAVPDRCQGQGVGTARLAAAIDLADTWLGLRRRELHVYPDNAAGIHLYETVGFVIEGVARDFALRDGVFVDALVMARLRSEPGGDCAGQSR